MIFRRIRPQALNTYADGLTLSLTAGLTEGLTPVRIFQNLYLQPDGTSLYLQPDGSSLYLQP
jgi:hypothetical protein